MAKKDSQLPEAGTLDGTEIVAIVQDGASVRTTTQDIADLGGGGAVDFWYWNGYDVGPPVTVAGEGSAKIPLSSNSSDIVQTELPDGWTVTDDVVFLPAGIYVVNWYAWAASGEWADYITVNTPLQYANLIDRAVTGEASREGSMGAVFYIPNGSTMTFWAAKTNAGSEDVYSIVTIARLGDLPS